ncbi:hypothetical protein KUF83_13325 [Streptomyces sp. BV286]|uniref:hypothetical protein n=1 Tax=Streptomyces sp. BV286 TaxID=2849672 RepID=UPI001C2E9092|nr:hypothetical protein [Streptomyces sp. BV286]MBV1937534.1 hypothetical protein [Streptomyces sp. BV286]
MDHTENVDQDAVLRARTMLLGSGRPDVGRQVGAYRVLSAVSPLTYLPKLTEALLSYGYAPEVRDLPDVRLARYAEAAVAARRIDAGEHNRTELLVRALSAYRRELCAAGRRAEGLAVCEEMAEAGRWGFAHGQVPSPVYGQGPLAVVLAEEGRHQEAADLCGESVRIARSKSSAEISKTRAPSESSEASEASDAPESPEASFWELLEWAAELDAAGCHDAALEVFADIVAGSRAKAARNGTALAILIWQLVHRAGMLDAAGQCVEARAARLEALTFLSELDRTGERESWSNILTWWVTLYALSGRSAEPPPRPGSPAPPFGAPFLDWSPDVRQTYVDGLAALEEQAAGLKEAARAEPSGRLPEVVALHRRLTIRAAVRRENRSHLILKPLRPLFDEGVALARDAAYATGADTAAAVAAPADQAGATGTADTANAEQSRKALARALTDRSMFLVAAGQYGEAHDDYCEALDLLG